MLVTKAIVEYHYDTVPAPVLIVGECAHIFPAEMMIREDDNVVQRKYGLTKTDVITSVNVDGSFETQNTLYVLVTNLVR
jgi:hypothetical protein